MSERKTIYVSLLVEEYLRNPENAVEIIKMNVPEDEVDGVVDMVKTRAERRAEQRREMETCRMKAKERERREHEKRMALEEERRCVRKKQLAEVREMIEKGYVYISRSRRASTSFHPELCQHLKKSIDVKGLSSDFKAVSREEAKKQGRHLCRACFFILQKQGEQEKQDKRRKRRKDREESVGCNICSGDEAELGLGLGKEELLCTIIENSRRDPESLFSDDKTLEKIIDGWFESEDED